LADAIGRRLHYFMPTRRTTLRRERDLEFSAADEVALFDEDKPSMVVRIRRLNTGLAWEEEPPSRTRHLVSNVRIGDEGQDQYAVHSYFALHRSRLERDVDLFYGERIDRLRRADTPFGFVIARRTIHLDQATVLAPNLSMFF
jgi:3-phenylpropionate/cinnamic acid dioxygenase small subunit